MYVMEINFRDFSDSCNDFHDIVHFKTIECAKLHYKNEIVGFLNNTLEDMELTKDNKLNYTGSIKNRYDFTEYPFEDLLGDGKDMKKNLIHNFNVYDDNLDIIITLSRIEFKDSDVMPINSTSLPSIIWSTSDLEEVFKNKDIPYNYGSIKEFFTVGGHRHLYEHLLNEGLRMLEHIAEEYKEELTERGQAAIELEEKMEDMPF